MVDPRRRGGGDRGLGVVGDAETCVLDHVEIVGAVADRQRIDVVEVEGFGELDQGGEFGGAAKDWLFHLAGQFAVANHQFIGAVFGNPSMAAIALVKRVKPPEIRQV